MPSKFPNSARLKNTTHPILYEVNTRVLLNELSAQAGKRITLEKIPDSLLDEWSSLGFDAVWLMGVWTTGPLGVQIAREHQGLREQYKQALPDFTEDDVIGSPFAVQSYTVARNLGGKESFLALRTKLEKRGLGLILDFVSNHTARDHRWVSAHPEYYINGKDGSEKEKPEWYFRTTTAKGESTLAFGRDPYFPGWTDTAQLNIFHPEARKAMIDTLLKIAELADGVRCDMAMLLLRQVFADTWGELSHPLDAEPVTNELWKEAIERVKQEHPEFMFIAESYWDTEWKLQQLGFDYTYDKILYDRLLREGAASVRDHLKAERAYQRRSLRFLENHDEQRIARVLQNEVWQYAATMIAATIPGMLLVHEDQRLGRKIKLPVQLGRRPSEPESNSTKSFYTLLFQCLQDEVIRCGEWQLLHHHPAWHSNRSFENIIAYCWRKERETRLVVVNYAPQNSQCYVELALEGIEGSSLEFRDLMSSAVYVRDRAGLLSKGMYFDLPAYGMHLFEVKAAK